nr:unnamed protein product [Digitaria exilis]
MMEVEKPWEDLQQQPLIMEEEEEEEDLAAGGLHTREMRNKTTDLLNLKAAAADTAEEQGNKSVFFDPAKVSVHATVEGAEEDLVVGQKENSNEISIEEGKETDKEENINEQETNHRSSNGKLEDGSQSNGVHEISSGAETFTVASEEAQPLKLIAAIHESKIILPNWSGALDISNGSTSTTEVHEIEVEKDESVTKGKVSIEDYDLEKILDEQETHDLYCPNCKSCITRRVILKKRKRTVRQAKRDEPPKRPQLVSSSTQNPEESQEQQSPEVFRCLSCFAFFIPTDCGFDILSIFKRRGPSQQGPVLHPSAPQQTSEHCGSWLLSCFEIRDSPKKPTDAGVNNQMAEKPTTLVTPGPGQHIVEVPEATILDTPARPVPPAQRDEWDILKAIVYGGLVESITSLSVVSAAAASGAKTLDILILGMANLIGGLPVIYHNIADLRNTGDVAESSEQVGHYWLELGRRSKYRLHMVIAILSYILFGLLPPTIYGLSFRTSNNRENKMMVVAAASLVCIALLAIGKAHVKRPRTYITTLLYYLSIGFSSSGLSYVAGVLITRLLAHFGLVDQGGASALLFAQATGADAAAWASYSAWTAHLHGDALFDSLSLS